MYRVYVIEQIPSRSLQVQQVAVVPEAERDAFEEALRYNLGKDVQFHLLNYRFGDQWSAFDYALQLAMHLDYSVSMRMEASTRVDNISPPNGNSASYDAIFSLDPVR